MRKKSQGEIFGVALLFVIIIFGILVYSQIRALDPERNTDSLQEGRYKVLAEGTLNTILDMSTGCYVERGRDSMRDLINYCLDYGFANADPVFDCGEGVGTIQTCEYSLELLNETLDALYSDMGLVGEVPYELLVSLPANPDHPFYDEKLTNFGFVTLRNQTITEDNYRSFSFKRAPSGLRTWATSQRNINFELYLYYR